MKKLLLVDGSNIVMRSAFGGEIQPEPAVRTATGQIRRWANQLQASHLIVCLDLPGCPTWRKKLYPEYKAHRKVDTSDWLEHAAAVFAQNGWHVEALPGYEADDLIATLATRCQLVCPCDIISNDSDLLPLISGFEWDRRVWRPTAGGNIEEMDYTQFTAKCGFAPHIMPDFKAMTGEAGDNIPGVPGIGPKRALQQLQWHGNLEGVIEAGKLIQTDARGGAKDTRKVAEHCEAARLSKTLATLVTSAPLPPVNPSSCEFTYEP
jgi:DNA polymerase-1